MGILTAEVVVVMVEMMLNIFQSVHPILKLKKKLNREEDVGIYDVERNVMLCYTVMTSLMFLIP